MTTQAQRDHDAQHRVSTWHHSFDVEAWAERGVIVRDAGGEDRPVLMFRDRDEVERLHAALEHALACPVRPSEMPIVPTADVETSARS